MPQVLSGITELVSDDLDSYDNYSKNSEPHSLDNGPSDDVSNGDVLYASLYNNGVTVNSGSMYSNCCNTAMLDGVALHTCAHDDMEV